MKETANPYRVLMSLGYYHIVPLIPPGAVLSEKSTLYKRLHNPKKPRDERGKVPGICRNGEWFSYDWQKDHEPEPEFWQSIGAGVGIKPGPVFDDNGEQLPGHMLAIDADTYSAEHAAIVENILDKHIGKDIPKRVGRAPKALYVIRTDEDFRQRPIIFGDKDETGQRPNRVEFLTKGRQFVARGTHPKTMQPYQWARPLVAAKNLPFVPAAELREIVQELIAALPDADLAPDSTPRDATPVPPEKRRASLELVQKALQALPNTQETHPTRDHYILVMYATRGALPDNPNEAYDEFEEWALRYEDNTPDSIRDDWDGMTNEPYSGFNVLLGELHRVGKDDVRASLLARHSFDAAAAEAAAKADAEREAAEKEAPLPWPVELNPFQAPAISLTPLRQFDPKTLPRRQWLYGNHYIRKYVSATAAPSAVGKSSMTMVEALAMATGKPLLGVQPKGIYRVWIWNGEDPIEELELRIAAAMQHYGLTWADLGDRVFLDSGRVMPVVLATSGKQGAQIAIPVVEGVIAGMKANAIDVAIMDPFVSTFSGPETNEMFEPIVKKWGAIAGATNASVELVHHTRKLNGTETGVEDMRGGGALVAGARAKRVLARMSAAEAKKFGVREDDHRRFFRVADASVNMALPAVSGTTWFEMKGVPVGNGEGEGPLADMTGDQVGVATLRTLASTSNEMDETTVERIKDALRGGEWRENFRSNAWAGFAVADVMGLDPKEDRSEIEQTLREMKGMNAIKVDRRSDKNGNKVPFIVPVDEDNVSAQVDIVSENPFD